MVVEEGSVVQVEKELKHKDESEMKKIVDESNDESHNFENNKDTKHNASVDSAKEEDSLSEWSAEVIHGALEEQAGDSVVQTCPVVYSEKVSLLNGEVQVNMSAQLDISEASNVSESKLKENGEKLKSAEENVVFSATGVDTAFDRMAVEAIVQSASKF
ncbi:unnamed protein product [Fraxinus pennsylvanica]|uniref:Uncharacterized protein n=1 Tax=Fraxinus pennsylvanica TaxID=56036 RepID=A0AAD1Z438_9LAMI|nr:unnamed protein product [Fraxinus pennsylvanica]